MTSEVLSLLRSKNRCLSQLIEIAKTFEQNQLPDDLDNEAEQKKSAKRIDDFNRCRAAILKATELFNNAFNEKFNEISLNDLTPLVIEEMKAEIHKSEILYSSASEIDLKISTKIKESMNQIAKRLNEIRKSKSVLQKFHSPITNGEEMDTTL